MQGSQEQKGCMYLAWLSTPSRQWHRPTMVCGVITLWAVSSACQHQELGPLATCSSNREL